MKFIHRPTALPGANPETDRSVLCDGQLIGRVRQVEDDHNRCDRWDWACLWTGTDTGGYCDTLEEGLRAIRWRTSPKTLKELPPDRHVWKPGSVWD